MRVGDDSALPEKKGDYSQDRKAEGLIKMVSSKAARSASREAYMAGTLSLLIGEATIQLCWI
jgi:hypothetical protein